jgi:2-polyprenyl-3-methyl-5-hydroxy-6-metoxy-1,4-benzoquinol methylase
MKKEFLKILRCPKTGESLNIEDYILNDDDIVEGMLITADKNNKYPISNSIPRFVPKSNYADNFGMQWNKFSQTQLDYYSGLSVSKNRFFSATEWKPETMKGKWVLDIGCGAGRFAEIALSTGANVVALDYSSAVDACYENLKDHPNLYIVQGDIYELPFQKNSFDYVYSLGVLQHTPDVERAFFCLPQMLNNSGKICVDFYEKSWKSTLLPKYWLRPITKRIPKDKLFKSLEVIVPILLPISIFISKIPLIGKVLKRAIPVANLADEIPLNMQQLKEWALLDTFDWLSPEYDNPQNGKTVYEWLSRAHFKNIKVLKAGHLVGRGNF